MTKTSDIMPFWSNFSHFKLFQPFKPKFKTKIPIFTPFKNSRILKNSTKSNKIQFSCIQNHSKQFNTIHLGFEVTLVAFRTHLSFFSTITTITWPSHDHQCAVIISSMSFELFEMITLFWHLFDFELILNWFQNSIFSIWYKNYYIF